LGRCVSDEEEERAGGAETGLERDCFETRSDLSGNFPFTTAMVVLRKVRTAFLVGDGGVSGMDCSIESSSDSTESESDDDGVVMYSGLSLNDTILSFILGFLRKLESDKDGRLSLALAAVLRINSTISISKASDAIGAVAGNLFNLDFKAGACAIL
jgi:hypothetical protein